MRQEEPRKTARLKAAATKAELRASRVSVRKLLCAAIGLTRSTRIGWLVSIRGFYLRGDRVGEEGCSQRSRNRFVHSGGPVKIEEFVEIIGCAFIRKTKTAEAKNTLDTF